MKTTLAAFVAIVIMASQAQAGYFDFDRSKWNWTTIKQKVVEKVSHFFGYEKKDAAAPNPNDTNVANAPAPAQPEQAAEPAKKSGWGSWFGGGKNDSKTDADGKNPQDKIPTVLPEKRVNLSPKADMKKAATDIKKIEPARHSSKGVLFNDKNLIMGRNKIPVFEFKKFKERMAKVKVKSVPLLNVGEEPTVDAQAVRDFALEALPIAKSDKVEPLSAPPLTGEGPFKEMLGEKVVAALPIEKIEIPVLEPQRKVTAEKIAQMIYKLDPDVEYHPLTVVRFTEEDLKMLRAVILYIKKDQCHIAAGIFNDLIKSEKPELAAKSSLYLGVCLHEMNLPTEALTHLTKAIKTGDPKFVTPAVTSIVDDVQGQHEMEVAETLLWIKDSGQIPLNLRPEADYLKAKYHLKKAQYNSAIERAENVPPKHPRYYKAQYIAAVAEYLSGKADASLTRQRSLATELEKRGSDKAILTLVQLNIGRMAFQKGKFKESLEAFQKVPKEHPLWMQALTEQAWAQIQSKDASGAIGNMHSIQSPYFDNVFKPEGYVVRAIGYLHICQYADSYKSLMYLEGKYSPWMNSIEAYNKAHTAADTYQTVFKYLQGKANMDQDNLPFQFLREAARQRDFLNVQESINQLIDENGGYSFVKNLIEKDKRNLLVKRNNAITQVTLLKDKIKKAPVTPNAMKNLNTWKYELTNNEEFLANYEFKTKTIDEGLEGWKKITPKAQAHLSSVKTKYKEQAGKVLRGHFVRIAKEMKNYFENNELLKYEIYAGSGENIRYQVAGGKTGGPSKMNANRAPAGEKWDFSGEYWEDEIGHYRSSLKNNCATVQRSN